MASRKKPGSSVIRFNDLQLLIGRHQEANRRLAKYYHDSGQRELELEHLKLGGLESPEPD